MKNARVEKGTTESGHSKPKLERLLRAILDDDRLAAEELLENEPHLSGAFIDQAKLYQSKICH
jgi:hypothetical protein